MLVRTVGLFLREDCVYWGNGNNSGALYGVPFNVIRSGAEGSG
jgi:hypothetical protein